MENRYLNSVLQVLLLLCALFLNPLYGKCTCEAEDGDVVNHGGDVLVLKIVSIVVILVASGIGVCLPTFGRSIPALHPDNNIFIVLKAFSAGVILATAFIHIFPDAFEDLTSPCLPENPWRNFPFAGFISMLFAILTLMADSLATGYFRLEFKHKMRRETELHPTEARHEIQEVVAQQAHGHSHGSFLTSSAESILRDKVIAQVLELGILVHSVLIGMAVGVSQSPSTIKSLMAALSFHQLFEGIGLGGSITQAGFNTKKVAWMSAFFALTTPAGIAIGIGITKVYRSTSATALIAQGLMNSAASGILIYMSLVDLLAAIFMDPALQENKTLTFASFISLFLGAGAMSVIAKWA